MSRAGEAKHHPSAQAAADCGDRVRPHRPLFRRDSYSNSLLIPVCWWSRRVGGISCESAALTCSVSLAVTPAPPSRQPRGWATQI
jgi:hypothetical protein